MGNLISLFLLSMLTTEPETSNPGEITFLEHSCSTQVQQTPLLMPELGSTPILGQKRLNLGHTVPDEYCFQSKAEKVLRKKQFLHFPFQKVPGKLPKPRARTRAATLRALSCHSSNQGQLAEQCHSSCETQLGHLEHCKCTFWSTHILGVPVPLPADYTQKQKVLLRYHSKQKLWGSSYHSWFTAAAITPTRLTRLSALTLLSDLCLETFYFDYKL